MNGFQKFGALSIAAITAGGIKGAADANGDLSNLVNTALTAGTVLTGVSMGVRPMVEPLDDMDLEYIEQLRENGSISEKDYY